MPDSVKRKEGVGNIWTDNPYGGPMFLSAPGSVTGGFGGGAGFSLGGGGGGQIGLAVDPSLGTGVGPGLATTAAAGGHAVDPITMAALASVIGNALGSAFAPTPYQQRTGFTGEASPQSWLEQFRGTTSATLENALSRLTDPTNVENLRVQDLGSFASDPGLYGDFGRHTSNSPRVSGGTRALPAAPQRLDPSAIPPTAGVGGGGTGPTRIRPNVMGNAPLAPSSPFGAPSAVPTSQAHGAAQLLLQALTMPTQSGGQGQRGARAA